MAKRPEHHEAGPSSLFRRDRCAGSLLAERGLKERSGPDSLEGTELHFAVVEQYQAHVELTITTNDEQQDQVDKCLVFLNEYDNRGEEWHLEEPLELFNDDLELVSYGTPDAFKIFPEIDLAILGDWKFGRNAVSSPAMNLQFAAYAAMIMQKYGVSRVEAHLIQPRVWETAESYEYTQLRPITQKIESIIGACMSIDATRVAGDQCKYCLANDTCDTCAAFRRAVLTLSPLGITSDNACDIASQITQTRKACDMAADILKQMVRDEGGMLGGLELIDKRGDRVASVRGLFGEMKSVMNSDEYMELCSPSIAKVEKLFADRAKDLGLVKTKKAAKAAFNALPCITRKTSSQQLKIHKD